MHKITFQNSKGLKLIGALHEPKDIKNRVVVIAHGFTSNKDRERHKKLASSLADENIAAFRIDFGGSGESSDREITIAAQIDDLQSAIRHLKNQGYKHIGLLGESLGGAVALQAYTPEIEAMVLWAPVTKARQTTKMNANQEQSLKEKGFFVIEKDDRQFKIPQEYIDEREDFNQAEILRKIKIPIMIVHGTTDKTIPMQDSVEALEFLPAGSVLEKIEGWEHGDREMNEKMDVIIPKTIDWFKNNLNY